MKVLTERQKLVKQRISLKGKLKRSRERIVMASMTIRCAEKDVREEIAALAVVEHRLKNL